MLADFLKRREYEARNPETVVQLKEAHKLLAEKDEALAQKDQALAQKDEEIKQLKERLGLNGDDC